jgi:hypothetical protein
MSVLRLNRIAGNLPALFFIVPLERRTPVRLFSPTEGGFSDPPFFKSRGGSENPPSVERQKQITGKMPVLHYLPPKMVAFQVEHALRH